MQGFKEIEEVEAFLLKHGENIVDMLGAEVDRIEKELKVFTVFVDRNQIKKFLILIKCLKLKLILEIRFVYNTEKTPSGQTRRLRGPLVAVTRMQSICLSNYRIN